MNPISDFDLASYNLMYVSRHIMKNFVFVCSKFVNVLSIYHFLQHFFEKALLKNLLSSDLCILVKGIKLYRPEMSCLIMERKYWCLPLPFNPVIIFLC